jgi:hypothetical protein
MLESRRLCPRHQTEMVEATHWIKKDGHPFPKPVHVHARRLSLRSRQRQRLLPDHADRAYWQFDLGSFIETPLADPRPHPSGISCSAVNSCEKIGNPGLLETAIANV